MQPKKFFKAGSLLCLVVCLSVVILRLKSSSVNNNQLNVLQLQEESLVPTTKSEILNNMELFKSEVNFDMLSKNSEIEHDYTFIMYSAYSIMEDY